MDYVIMGFKETNSEEFAKKGWIGAILGGLFVGGELVEKVAVGSMTFETREALSKFPEKYIGRVMEVGGNEIFRSGAIRHPHLIGIKPIGEKTAKECIWSE